ncbi:hypothetical protein [Oceanicoccus sp. KOV_DT_Chl]|uniref:hypothetical protein n=1 Tax=Oceanicoccus sp. KOV_DT_Chl TaxID=1904639 RepID=UPI000C7D14AA|nr:hypothetical protein [Oceanicoccus sp. KOV_DT_Chl]
MKESSTLYSTIRGLCKTTAGLALGTLVSSANAVEIYQSFYFDRAVSADSDNSSYSTSFDINHSLSTMLGEVSAYSSGQYLVSSGSFSVSYSRELIDVDHDDYTLSYSDSERVVNAGPRTGNYEGTDYAYVVEYARSENYSDQTGTNNQAADINFAGESAVTQFWGYYGEPETVTTLESSTFPIGTSGLLEEHYLDRHYMSAGAQGSQYFDISHALLLANDGILDFDFTATVGNLSITQLSLNIAFSENPNWVMTPPTTEVPLPAAAYLFSTALLSLSLLRKK